MTEEVPTIIHHASLGSNNLEQALEFYDKVLATIGAGRIMSHPGAVAYGKQFPEFWVQETFDGLPADTGNGVHFAFFATSREQVDSFHAAVLDAGGTDDGLPGSRPDYGAPYYGCFCRDLDGHKIEAVFWDESQA
jgi:catechol 2,3-dioxygenase-like lactoylglutathione lyase family enzyme